MPVIWYCTYTVISDASYLSATKAHNRARGHFYLSDKPTKAPQSTT
jgi:hypothetical protein